MASFTAGTTFVDGVSNDVTAAKLGALVTNATPTSGFIQDRTQEAIIATNDTLLIGDASDSSNLKRITVANFAQTLPTAKVTTGTIETGTFGTTTSTAATITTGTIGTLVATGTITGSTNVINIGSGQIYKDSSGQVGIGTTTPYSKLNIFSSITSGDTGEATGVGSLRITNGASALSSDGGLEFKIAGDSGGYGAKIQALNSSGVQLAFANRSATGTWTERMRIDSSGNVGIGTASPSEALNINGSTNLTSAIRLQNQGTNVGFISNEASFLGSGSSNNFAVASIGTTSLLLATNGAERLRIDSSGNVLANTTSTALFSATSGSGLCYRKGASLDILATNDNALILNKIGADGSIAEFRKAATIVGTITVSGSATAYNTSSDYRLKTNLDQISDGIARIKQLPVYRFNWLADVNGNKVDGFVAHEAKEIVPECVVGEKDAVDADGNPIYQGIDQSKIVPLLTAALKEAISKIEILESKVAALEAA